MIKTKFILHGGNSSEICLENKRFYEECFSDYKNGDDILYIPFAGYKKDWNLKKIKGKLENFLGKEYNLILGDLKNLDNQILNSKYIYINGGDYKKLYKYIGYLKNKKDYFIGKTIIGVSAGANILAKYSYSNDYKEVFEGWGFLNIKTYCHYDGNNENEKSLDNYMEKLPVFVIKDMEYIVLI